MEMLVELATLVTNTPWQLSRTHRERAHAAGFTDDDLLHAIALSAYFGHLNRIADATGVPLDYQVKFPPPPADPSVPALAPAPVVITARPAIELAQRPATAAAISAWRAHVFERDEPLPRRQRTFIARWVALWLGDGGISSPDDLTHNPFDDGLRALAEVVTLAPWQLGDHSYAALRTAGFDDAALFDAVVTASTAGMLSRIAVALGALGRGRA
jgi:alkylhydroperoxidase family enzyme